MESILKDLSELQGQMSTLQFLARDLQGEKEKVSPSQSLRGLQECLREWQRGGRQRRPWGPCPASSTTALPRSDSCRMPLESWV